MGQSIRFTFTFFTVLSWSRPGLMKEFPYFRIQLLVTFLWCLYSVGLGLFNKNQNMQKFIDYLYINDNGIWIFSHYSCPSFHIPIRTIYWVRRTALANKSFIHVLCKTILTETHFSALQLVLVRDAIIKENPVKSGFLQIGGVSGTTRSRFFTCRSKCKSRFWGGGDSESGITDLKVFEHSFCWKQLDQVNYQ